MMFGKLVRSVGNSYDAKHVLISTDTDKLNAPYMYAYFCLAVHMYMLTDG